MEVAKMTIASLMADVSSVSTTVIKIFGDFITLIGDNPLLLVPCILGIVGISISLFKFFK